MYIHSKLCVCDAKKRKGIINITCNVCGRSISATASFVQWSKLSFIMFLKLFLITQLTLCISIIFFVNLKHSAFLYKFDSVYN